MGLITNWIGCTPEATVIEFGLGTFLFIGWFAIMWILARAESKRQKNLNNPDKI